MKLSKIKPNPSNPRTIRDDKFNKLVKSIQQFPAMMEKRPIVVDETMTVLGGNMRLRALQHIYGKSGDIPDNWVTVAQGWTEEQKREVTLPFPEEAWLAALRGRLPAKLVEVNLKAFALGRAALAL